MDDFPSSQPNYDSTERLTTFKRRIEAALKTISNTKIQNEKENAFQIIKMTLFELLDMGDGVTIGDLRVTKIGKLMTKIESSTQLPENLTIQATKINSRWKDKLHLYRQQLKITLSDKKNKLMGNLNSNSSNNSTTSYSKGLSSATITSTNNKSNTTNITTTTLKMNAFDRRANSFPPFTPHMKNSLSFPKPQSALKLLQQSKQDVFTTHPSKQVVNTERPSQVSSTQPTLASSSTVVTPVNHQPIASTNINSNQIPIISNREETLIVKDTSQTQKQQRLIIEENKRQLSEFTSQYSKLLDSNISSIISVQRECVKMMESTHSMRAELSNFKNEMFRQLESSITSIQEQNTVFQPASSFTNTQHENQQHLSTSNSHQTQTQNTISTISAVASSTQSPQNQNQGPNIISSIIKSITHSVNQTTIDSHQSTIINTAPCMTSSSSSSYTTNNILSIQSRGPSISQSRILIAPQPMKLTDSNNATQQQKKPKSNLDSVLSTMSFHPKRKSSFASSTQKPSHDAPVAKKPREILRSHSLESLKHPHDQSMPPSASKFQPPNQYSHLLTNQNSNPLNNITAAETVNPLITCIPNSEDEFSNSEDQNSFQQSIRKQKQHQQQNGEQQNHSRLTELQTEQNSLQQQQKFQCSQHSIRKHKQHYRQQNGEQQNHSLQTEQNSLQQQQQLQPNNLQIKQEVCFEISSDPVAHSTQNNTSETESASSSSDEPRKSSDEDRSKRNGSTTSASKESRDQTNHVFQAPSSFIKNVKQEQMKPNGGGYEQDEELFTYSQQIVEMEEEEELDEEDKNYLQNEKGKLRSSWNNRCKRAAGIDIAPRKKSHGRLVAAHSRPLGKEVMHKMLNRKKQEETIKKLFEQDDIWEVFDRDDDDDDEDAS